MLLLLQNKLLCPSQAMIDSWSVPFVDAFSGLKDVQLFEVCSYIDLVLGSSLPLVVIVAALVPMLIIYYVFEGFL